MSCLALRSMFMVRYDSLRPRIAQVEEKEEDVPKVGFNPLRSRQLIYRRYTIPREPILSFGS